MMSTIASQTIPSTQILIIFLLTTINPQYILTETIIENKKPTNSNLQLKKQNNKIQTIELIKDDNNKVLKTSIEQQYDDNENINQIDKLTGSTNHSRKKRLIWVTQDGRLALPPGTVLSISPTISLPLVRYPPSGFLSNLTMSFPLTIDFDKLGLTDNENPLGVLPPIFARSMGRAAGSFLANYIGEYLKSRTHRDTSTQDENNNKFKYEKLPENHQHVFHGGERAILYGVVEDLIATFGFNGKACILRAICEVHSRTIQHLGLFGEIIKLFFTATKSQYSELLTEYVRAEKIGEGTLGPGECFPYYKDCPVSLFKGLKNHYKEIIEDEDEHHHMDDRIDEEKNYKVNSVDIDLVDQSRNEVDTSVEHLSM